MQLKNRKETFLKATSKKETMTNKSISGSLALATCALLNSTASMAQSDGKWQVDSGVLLYSEQDRVDAVEPAIKLTRHLDGDKNIAVKLVVDTLTGASPNGASPTNTPQTFTRPSGRGEYTTPAGDIPLDDTFHDSRTQIAINYDQPWGETSRINVGANLSSEFDYTSIGFNGSWQKDFNLHNTTLLFGLAFAADQADPIGGIPTPFASMQPAGSAQPREGSNDSKTVADFIAGLTQVINRNTLMQWNYSYSQVSGYQNDPFKVVSIVDNVTGVTLDNIYENRPDTRAKHSLFWKTKYFTPWHDTVELALRYMTDDWGIDSTTIDLHYRWNLGEKWYLEPHYRLYNQTAADFYRHSVPDNVALGDYLSADYRLAEFDATTFGIKFGYDVSDALAYSIRLESYQQSGDKNPSDAIGVQQQVDLFPDLDATIVQFGFRYRW